MTRRTRSVLFWVLVALFIVGGVSLILFVIGYRVDFGTMTLEKVGGVFAKTNTQNYNATLEGKHLTKHYAIPNELFVSGLTPGSYTLDITKDHYVSWKKEFTVLPNLVTSFKEVMLLPDPLTPTRIFTASSSLASLSLSPDATRIAYADTIKHTIISYDLAHKSALYSIKEHAATGFAWLSDNNSFWYESATQNAPLLIDTRGATNIQTIFKHSLKGFDVPSTLIIHAIYPHPFEPKLIIHTSSGIFAFDPRAEISTLLASTDPVTLAVTRSSLYYFDANGRLYSENLITKNPVPTSFAPFDALASSPHTHWTLLMSPDENTVAAYDTTHDKLYLGTSASTTLSLVDTDVSSPSFSPDSKKIAYLKQGIPTLYWIEADEELRKTPQEIDTLLFGPTFSSFAWYEDSAHLFGTTVNHTLYFLDTDNRMPLGITKLAANINYSMYSAGNTMYYTVGNTLFSINFDFPARS
ncbi:MAG: hypothetical protein KGI50_01945 [Patescibacteria group bacterium]|nr:hypothetical protein [Patescibacteria group bacterium]MDE2437893.1 hypothetical protein [Patescibacteria group bacterium]